MRVGTWGWAERTGGRLSRREQLTEIMRGARARILAGPGAEIAGQVELAESPPDSGFAAIALEAATDLSSPELLGHCLRTWLWADLFSQADLIQHDGELLYAACLLHDLGLTEAHWCQQAACFAVEGARAAKALADENGYPRADALAESISLHLNVSVPPSLGAEAHLLHEGASMDVIGARSNELPTAVKAAALAEHPYDGFTEEIDRLTTLQSEARPRSRIALLRRLGFGGLIERGGRTLGSEALDGVSRQEA